MSKTKRVSDPEMSVTPGAAARDLVSFSKSRRFATILADPPWQFTNKTGKVAPEHKRLSRYGTMKLDEIMALPITELAAPTSHLYLWCPNAMLPEGLSVLKAWGFTYKWLGRPRRGILFSQCDGADTVRRAGQKCPHPRAGTPAGKFAGDAQKGAFAQTRRAI